MNPKWQPFVKTALIGTQRAALPKLPVASPLTEFLNQIETSEPEAALLSIAGVMALHEQAGQILAQITPPIINTAIKPERPEPPIHIARRLSKLLEGQYAGVLSEFLQTLGTAGFRVPTTYLPNLLDKGARMITVRPVLLPVLGQRGHQLAAMNPKWAYAALQMSTWQTIAAQWHQTEPGKRYMLLRQLREIAPDKGRQTLETTWRSETDMVRNQLIKLLSFNISMADEPFLERALDDRNHLVRIKAAELLTYLPESRLCRRMSGHTHGVLTWMPHQKTKITVRFPKVISNTMVRDGILKQSTMDKVRLRTRQLIQMINGVPLNHWTEYWQVTPDEIIQALPDTTWQRTLTTSFTTAAHRQQNALWARAILEHEGIRDQTARLVSILPETDCRELVEKISNRYQSFLSLEKSSSLRLILSQWPHKWDEELASYWITCFAHHMTQQSEENKFDPSITIVTRKFAKLCPPALMNEAVQQLTSEKIHPTWRKTAVEMVDMISFRHEMVAEIEAAAKRHNDNWF